MDVYRHVIHQINGHAKPDFVVVVPDLYDGRRRRQGQKRARRPHPEPQEPLIHKNDTHVEPDFRVMVADLNHQPSVPIL